MNHLLVVLFAWIFLAGPVMAQTPARIISLAPSQTEILYDLGLGDRVVAVSRYCDYPAEARAKPKIGGMSNPSLEAIVAMKPDMVVLTKDGNPRDIERKLRNLNIRTHVFRAKRLKELPDEIRSMGAALGVADSADRSAGRIESVVRRYAQRAQKTAGQTPQKVLLVVQPDPLVAAGPGTVMDDVLTLLGLQNIAANAKTQYPRYSLEDVILQSPDIIIIGKGHDVVMTRSRRLLKKLNRVEAVRQGRVYYINSPLFRLGPRIADGIVEVAEIVERTKK